MGGSAARVRAQYDDAKRLLALRDYRVLDTPAEEIFDNITELATKLLGVPIALVSLVDEHRQWFKSRIGLEVAETPRDIAFCNVAIRGQEPLVVADATKDLRFARNPMVKDEPHIRFYCGVPLRSPEGHALGTLCILDRVPRTINARDQAALEALARQVELELEIRRRLALLEDALAVQDEQQRAKDLLASMVVHDLRSPLSAITALASLVQTTDVESLEVIEDLLAAAEKMRGLLTDLLDVCLSDVGGLRPRRVDFSLAALFQSVARLTRRAAHQGRQTVLLELAEPHPLVNADPALIERVLVNLIDNAVQHGPADEPIRVVAANVAGGQVRIEVRDRGTPIPEESRESIFRPFERLRGADPQASRGYGLGLTFCRLAIEAHGGHIAVSPISTGGNCFHFELSGATFEGAENANRAGVVATGAVGEAPTSGEVPIGKRP